MNPYLPFTFKTHFNIILSFKSVSSKQVSFLQGYYQNPCMHYLYLYSLLKPVSHTVTLARSNMSFIHLFILLSCAECNDSLPFSGASSIPLCYILFLTPFSTNYSSILPHFILPSVSWSTSGLLFYKVYKPPIFLY
jgi:hypothetical protein